VGCAHHILKSFVEIVNPLISPNLGGFLEIIGDTPKTPAGDFSPASL
jgi:hypothetical protein